MSVKQSDGQKPGNATEGGHKSAGANKTKGDKDEVHNQRMAYFEEYVTGRPR